MYNPNIVVIMGCLQSIIISSHYFITTPVCFEFFSGFKNLPYTFIVLSSKALVYTNHCKHTSNTFYISYCLIECSIPIGRKVLIHFYNSISVNSTCIVVTAHRKTLSNLQYDI